MQQPVQAARFIPANITPQQYAMIMNKQMQQQNPQMRTSTIWSYGAPVQITAPVNINVNIPATSQEPVLSTNTLPLETDDLGATYSNQFQVLNSGYVRTQPTEQPVNNITMWQQQQNQIQQRLMHNYDQQQQNQLQQNQIQQNQMQQQRLLLNYIEQQQMQQLLARQQNWNDLYVNTNILPMNTMNGTNMNTNYTLDPSMVNQTISEQLQHPQQIPQFLDNPFLPDALYYNGFYR